MRIPMDKQQAARVAFEDEMDKLGWKTDHHVSHYGQQITYTYNRVQEMWLLWQAAQAALMPALVEARNDIDEGGLWIKQVREGLQSWKGDLPLGIVCGLGARLQTLESWHSQALARINLVIGDKK